jgi:NAD(P)H-flavin reductase
MSDAATGRYRDPLLLPAADPDLRVRRTISTRGRILRLRALTRDMVELVVLRDRDAPAFHAQAGQFAVLRVAEVEGPRPFSLARAPAAEAPGEHTFLIRRVPGGAFSEWLGGADRTGVGLELTGPLGHFTLDRSHAPMLCIAGGSGLSAIRALVEHAALAQVARDCWLYYGARTRADLCLGEEIAALAARWHPVHRLHFVQVLSEEPAASSWAGARGMVADFAVGDAMAGARLDVTAAQAYLCGPPPMIAAAEHLLALAGMPPEAIHRDVFEDTRSQASALVAQPVSGATPYAAVVPGRTPGLYYGSLVVDERVCIRCGACVQACPHGAISTAYPREAVVTLRRQP